VHAAVSLLSNDILVALLHNRSPGLSEPMS